MERIGWKLLKKLFYEKIWNISYSPEKFNNIDLIKNLSFEKFLIKSAADPYYFEFGNSRFVIYEKISKLTNKGTINIFDLEKNEDYQILKKRYNLSFPSVHILKNKIFLFCECAETKSFKYWELNENFEVIKEIAAFDEPIIDPAVLKINEDYLIIGCKRLGAEQQYKNVFYKSKDLINWFKINSQNINIEKGQERNAGQIFQFQESQFRFAQILEPIYGTGVVVNKIHTATVNSYHEEKIKEIRIESGDAITGIHTVSPDMNGFYFDYRMEKFNLFASIYKVFKYCRKILIKLFPPKI